MKNSSKNEQPSSSSIPSNNLYSSDTPAEQMSVKAVPSTSRDPVTAGQDSTNKKRISNLLNGGISKDSPRSYNLYCLDADLIPKSIQNKCETIRRVDLKDICFYMKPDLSLPSSKLDFINLNESCYVVRYHSQSSISETEKFISRLFREEVRANMNKQNVAAMIIIPIPDTSRALAYSIGRAQSSIMNKHAIVKQWGLELVASKDITSKSIKELTVLSQHENKRKTKITKTSLPGCIGVFSPEAGGEHFYKLRLKRDGGKGYIEGSTKFQFKLTHRRNKENGDDLWAEKQPGLGLHNMESDIQTLVAIGRELYEIYTKNNIHPEYADYISKKVDDTLTRELNNELVQTLTGRREDYDNYFFDLNPDVLRWEVKKILGEYDNYRIWCKFLDTLHKTMVEDGGDLESLINLNNDDGKILIKEEPVCALLTVDAFARGENLYNYTSGKWFQVPPCRFPYIRKEIARDEIGYKKLGLICYTKKHEEKIRITNQGKLAKQKSGEFNYNADAAKALSIKKVSDIRGILCDHIKCKYVSTNNFIFEFTDIFMTHNSRTELGESHCIIHVKRRAANDFEKQCTQLLRTVEFLYSIVNKKQYSKVLLLGCVNTLYASHDLPIIEPYVENGDQDLTFCTEPIKCSKRNDHCLNTVVQRVEKHCKHRSTTFQGAMLDKAPQFFEKYKNLMPIAVKDLVISINALFYCDSQGKVVTLDDAEIFCDLVQHFYGAAEEVFHNRPSQNTERQKKLYFVLAIIDDKKTAMTRNSEDQHVDNITDQDLLTMYALKQKVEGSKFTFKWAVIEKERKDPKKEDSEEEDPKEEDPEEHPEDRKRKKGSRGELQKKCKKEK